MINGDDLGLGEYELKPVSKKKNVHEVPKPESLSESIKKVMDEVYKEPVDESDPARRMKALMQGAEPKNNNEKKLLAEIKQMIAEGKIIDIPEM